MSEQSAIEAPLKFAVSVDDLFQWEGVPFPDGYDSQRCSRALIKAFADNGVSSVYAFSCTRPMELDPSLSEVLDNWCDCGHHVGTHTHTHCSCNWVPADTFLADVDRGDEIIESWASRAPNRYFRHPFGHAGDTAEKVTELAAGLARRGHSQAPFSLWFYDAQFIPAYARAVGKGDQETKRWLQEQFVGAAISQLEGYAAAQQKMFGRVPAQIGLVHGSAIAADAYDRVLEAYAERGVEFVTLEEALADPVNKIEPHTTRRFRDLGQKWSEATGIPLEGAPPSALLQEVSEACPVEGQSDEEVFGAALVSFAARLGSEPNFEDFEI